MANKNSDQEILMAKPAKKKFNLFSRLKKLDYPNKNQESAKEKEIDKELRSIYKDAKGNMPNLTKLDFTHKNHKRNLIIAAIIVLLIIFSATVLGFFAFKPTPKFSGKKVNLEIKAPFTLKSGEKINYQIRLSNNEGVSLSRAKLTVNLPENFIFTNANIPSINTPEQNPKIKIWNINDLFIGQTQIIDINGIMISPLNNKELITAAFTYIPANFSSEFEKTASFTTEINESLIKLSSESTAQVAQGEISEIKVKLANQSTQIALSNLRLNLDFPDEFILLETQALNPGDTAKPLDVKALAKNKPDSSPKITELTSLLPQEEKTIIYRGKFNVPESKKVDLNLKAELKNQKDEYITQTEAKITTEVIKGELLTRLIIQGSDQNKPVNFGETLNYLLTVENKSSKTLGDIKVRVVLNSLFLDWKTLNDQNKGIQEDNQILWTTNQIPGLANLLPEGEIEIPFQITLKNFGDVKNYKAENLLVKSFFEAQVNKMNNADTELTNESNTISNEFNTNLTFSSEGRYFGPNSETLGSGPLPPIVGQKTAYKIFWQLNNSLHEISDIVIKAKLPDYIVFEDNQNLSTGNLFKNQNNEIIWQIARIPNSVIKSTADFEISITPQAQDVAKILTLLQEGSITATDSQTQGQISLSFSGLTTNLDTDPLGKGKGLILAE